MKNFFTSFFGAIVGVIVSLVICTIIVVASLIGTFNKVFKSDADKVNKIAAKSVLIIDFKSPIVERKNENPLAQLKMGKFGEDQAMELHALIEDLKKAKTDDNIKGIYISSSSVPLGIASTEELRNALLDFKTSGKFIYAYSEEYNQKGYYLASVADKIYLNPQGALEMKGLSAQLMFFKKMMTNLQIEVQIFRHGKFKSAIEPFILDKMSEANRMQTEAFMGSIWKSMLNGISSQRKISVEELNHIADNLLVKDTQSAVDLKLVDALKYEDEVQAIIKQKIGLGEKEKLSFVKIDEYGESTDAVKDSQPISKKDKIAVIYANGQITGGEGDIETVGSESMIEALREARLDEKVKAIVLRINSPGGSALASDVMWREIVLAKKAKPLVVSMGDVAASGGYYIACAADRIYAENNTITGSIGVFGIMPNAQKLLSEKLGINIDTVNTNKYSDIGTIFRPVSEKEREYIQKSVEDIYTTFTTRVAEGRKLSLSMVDSIGQGRVWSGADALRLKLVDEIGGLNNAIAYAANKANSTNYRLVSLPKQKNPFEAFMNKKAEEAEMKLMSVKLGQQYEYIKHIKTMLNMRGVQARMPFDYLIY